MSLGNLGNCPPYALILLLRGRSTSTRDSLGIQVKLGCGEGEVTDKEYEAVSYMNAQHSKVFTTKSSRGASGSFPYVLQDCVLPWYRSPSNHNPNLPLQKDQRCLLVSPDFNRFA